MRTSDVISELFRKLRAVGLKPWIYTIAQTGSVYVKFADTRMRSLRIGDHNGREKYRYKWNLRFDVKDSFEETDRGVHRFYFAFSDIDGMVKRMKQYKEAIEQNETNIV